MTDDELAALYANAAPPAAPGDFGGAGVGGGGDPMAAINAGIDATTPAPPTMTADQLDALYSNQAPTPIAAPDPMAAINAAIDLTAERPKAGFLDRGWNKVSDYVTGAGKNPQNLPELSEMSSDEPGQTLSGSARLALAYALGSDPQQIADVALKVLPGATLGHDQDGNPLIGYNGKSYYVNKPGMSAADVANAGGLALTTLIPGGIISKIPALAGAGLIQTPVRAALGGVGQAAVSAARDYVTGLVGSDQGVSTDRAVGAGVLGAAAEPAVALASKALGGVGYRRSWAPGARCMAMAVSC